MRFSQPGNLPENAESAMTEVWNFGVITREILTTVLEETGVEISGLITFHDGFGYFADTFHLTILRSIEEEEGSEASAKDINEIVALIEESDLPAIFVEANGSDATAQAIARETGVEVAQLSMIMSGEGAGLDPYVEAMAQNIGTVRTALGGTEGQA